MNEELCYCCCGGGGGGGGDGSARLLEMGMAAQVISDGDVVVVVGGHDGGGRRTTMPQDHRRDWMGTYRIASALKVFNVDADRARLSFVLCSFRHLDLEGLSVGEGVGVSVCWVTT